MNAGHMDIRTVTIELLRSGPRHNQLISPLTQYLGVCGNAAAGRLSLPYEHGDLELRLQELRYRVARVFRWLYRPDASSENSKANPINSVKSSCGI